MFSRIAGQLLKMRSRFLDGGVALLWFNLIIEAVADARDGEDEPRALGNRLDFLAQQRHIDMQAVRPGMCLSSPDLFQQQLPRENLAPVGDEDLEVVLQKLRGNAMSVGFVVQRNRKVG
jgi:hypothetical protein